MTIIFFFFCRAKGSSHGCRAKALLFLSFLFIYVFPSSSQRFRVNFGNNVIQTPKVPRTSLIIGKERNTARQQLSVVWMTKTWNSQKFHPFGAECMPSFMEENMDDHT